MSETELISASDWFEKWKERPIEGINGNTYEGLFLSLIEQIQSNAMQVQRERDAGIVDEKGSISNLESTYSQDIKYGDNSTILWARKQFVETAAAIREARVGPSLSTSREPNMNSMPANKVPNKQDGGQSKDGR